MISPPQHRQQPLPSPQQLQRPWLVAYLFSIFVGQTRQKPNHRQPLGLSTNYLKQRRGRNQKKRQICREKKADPKWRRRKKRSVNKKEKTKINCLLCFLVFWRSPPARKGRGEEAALDPLAAWNFLQWPVGSRAASDGDV
jgi:hypothetical protein